MKKILVLVLLLFAVISSAQAQAPYYQGKTVTIIVGFGPGDGYDIWARILAAHMARHIPGSPNMIVQNMPGAGSLTAANYVYKVAKPDGLSLATVIPSLYLDQLVGRKEVQFQWDKFTWIGATERSAWVFYVRSDSPFKTLDDIRKAAQPPRCSATGTGTSGHFVPKLMEESLGLKFDLIMGYQGGSEQDMALERGEVQCRAISIPTFFSRAPFDTWRKTNFIRVLLQTGLKRDSRAPEVPTIHELMKEHKTPETTQRLVRAVLASGDMGRPFLAPPGVPPERARILRDAFEKTVNDAAFVAEANKKKLQVDPILGDELGNIARDAVSEPPELIERMKKLLGQ